jgi:hypothetical protein
LARGIRQVEEGDLESGFATLEQVARALRSNPAASRNLAQAYLYMGIASALLAQDVAARSYFREALREDAEVALNADRYPAKALRVFESARQEAVAAGVLRAQPPGVPQTAGNPPSSPGVTPVPTSGSANYVFVEGAVNHPGRVAIQGEFTVLQALALAGGAKATAAERAQVKRVDSQTGKTETIDVDLKAIRNGKRPDVALLPNDVLTVTEKFF